MRPFYRGNGHQDVTSMFVLVCACTILYVLVCSCIICYCLVDSCSILMILDSACPPYTFIPCHSHTIVLENSGLKKGLTYPYLMYLISFDCIQLVSLFTCQILPTCLIFLNILEPCGAAGLASCSCWHNPSISLYKMGTRVKKSPQKLPQKVPL